MGKLRPSLSLAEGEQDLSTAGGTDYTGPMPKTTFRDKSGREVTITATDMAPYLANPDLAQQEADVTKARYGGSSIQDSKAAAAAPFKKPEGTVSAQQPFPPRSVFERSIFNTLKSESNPTGNPFDINIPATIEQISKGDLPDLFNQVFNGQVIWEDRHLLDDEQKKYWLAEAKRYRAHLKEQVTAGKKTATDQYNQLMTRFDNEKKEYEAGLKNVKAKTKAFEKAKLDAKKEAAAGKKDRVSMQKRKSEILKDIATITTKIVEAAASGTTFTNDEEQAYRDQITALRDELQGINQEFGRGEMDMTPRGEIDTAEHEKKKLEGKKDKGEYGLREDGTKKGKGFLGELKRTDKKGMVSTELSIGVEFDGEETLIPALVPTLTKKEIDYLLSGGEMTDAIVNKAAEHAKKRIKAGLSPFKDDDEGKLKKIKAGEVGKIEKERKIKRTGTHKGRKVIQYEDGSIEYA